MAKMLYLMEGANFQQVSSQQWFPHLGQFAIQSQTLSASSLANTGIFFQQL